MRTPSSEMYADLREFGGMTNRDAAQVLLSPDASMGGMPLTERILDRPFLSSKIVHARPGSLDASCFSEFDISSQTLFSRMAKSHGAGPEARHGVGAHYAGPAAERMRQALVDCELDGQVYANAVERIAAARLASESDREVLYLLLFVACGCLGDPVAAVLRTERFCAGKLSSTLSTQAVSVDEAHARPATPAPPAGLGLLRIIDGAARPPLHVISTEPAGTVIGAFAKEAGGIADVDPLVSRRHLRIWREDGTWWAQGLGSTNGSFLVSGETRQRVVIEPPRSQREEGAVWPAVKVSNSDMLVLAGSTQFLVMAIAD